MSSFVGQTQLNRLKCKEIAGTDGVVQVLTNMGVSGTAQLNDATCTNFTSSGGVSAQTLNVSGNATLNGLTLASLTTGDITASGTTSLQALDAQATTLASLTSAGAVQAN